MIKTTPSHLNSCVSSPAIRLVVQDPNPLVSQGLVSYFNQTATFEAVAIGSDRTVLQEKLPQYRADVLLMGITHQPYLGIEFLSHLRSCGNRLPVFLLADVSKKKQ
jgi:DNA-binding NarL/FixJ family response regulator